MIFGIAKNIKMTLNANQKGKRFERDVAKMINKKFETNVRRTPMSGGM